MKYLIVIMLIVSFNAVGQVACKADGDKAAKVMEARQAEPDVFILLEKYKDDYNMVLDAYEVPMYDAMKHLENAIDARNKIIRADERRKYSDVMSKYENAIAQFRLKYIKECLVSLKKG